jgi:hypothetical protein
MMVILLGHSKKVIKAEKIKLLNKIKKNLKSKVQKKVLKKV